jgi:hypothetical protein
MIVLQEMAIICNRIGKSGKERFKRLVSRLMPSRSVDSISRLIDSTHFKHYRANHRDLSMPKIRCSVQIATPGTTDERQTESQVNPTLTMDTHHEHSVNETSDRIEISIPMAFNFVTSPDGEAQCSTGEVQCTYEAFKCSNNDSLQNIEERFRASTVIPSSNPVANLAFNSRSASPLTIMTDNHEMCPLRIKEPAGRLENKVDNSDVKLGGDHIGNTFLGSDVTGIENKIRAGVPSQPRSIIISRKPVQKRKMAIFNSIKISSTPSRFATSRARAFLAKAVLPQPDIDSTAEVST